MTLYGYPRFKYGSMALSEKQLADRAKRQQADIEAVGMARTFETCGRCYGFGVFRLSFQTRTCPDCAGIGWVPKHDAMPEPDLEFTCPLCWKRD